MKALLFSLALVCWFASCAGLQLLLPQSILAAWWPGQILLPLAQLGALSLAWNRWADYPPLARWLATLTLMAWPWQGQPQWLRIAPEEILAFLGLIGWGGTTPAAPRGSWAGLLLVLCQPACAAGWLASQAHNWIGLLLTLVLWPVKLQSPSWEHFGWAILALVLGWGFPKWRPLALFTLINASKGAPTSSLPLAVLVLELVPCWRWSPWWLGLGGSWLLAQAGETALNRQLIVPWQKQGLGLEQGLLPHSRRWWALHLGSLWGFSAQDLRRAEQLQGPTLIQGSPETRYLYWETSGGRSLLRPDPVAAEVLQRRGDLKGSGLWGAVPAEYPPDSAAQIELLEGDRIRLQARQPLSFRGEQLPHLVLQPGLNPLWLPLRTPARRYWSGQLQLELPARNWDQQRPRLKLGPLQTRFPCSSVERLNLGLTHQGDEPVNLEALAGLRCRLAHQPWQPIQPLRGSLHPGQTRQLQLLLHTVAAPGRWELQLWWEEPGGRRELATRTTLDLWAQQHPENYQGLQP